LQNACRQDKAEPGVSFSRKNKAFRTKQPSCPFQVTRLFVFTPGPINPEFKLAEKRFSHYTTGSNKRKMKSTSDMTAGRNTWCFIGVKQVAGYEYRMAVFLASSPGWLGPPGRTRTNPAPKSNRKL
jgi:hypothetical protein